MNKLYVWNCKNILFSISVLIVPVLSIESRSVNLALETTFLFDSQDFIRNATFIKNVQSVIEQVKNVLISSAPNEPVFRQHEDAKDEAVLTKFLSEIGSCLIHFDGADIRKFTIDLKAAVLKHANTNKYFNEIIEDKRLGAFIKNVVKKLADTDPLKLKVEIAKILTDGNTNTIVELFRVINKIFDSSDEAKFKKLLKKFAKAKQDKDFTKFLTKTIDFVVFKRFKKLNPLLKLILKEDLKKFAQYLNKNYGSNMENDNIDSIHGRKPT